MRNQPRIATILSKVLGICGLINMIGCGGGTTSMTGPVTFTIGGTVSGVTGSGMVLQDNGASNLSIVAGSTTFTFTTPIASGSAYSVTVFKQPSSPSQNCTVTNGTGTAGANVTNVQVTCTTPTTYTIGGTVSGLSGPGLVLQDDGGDSLPVSANGTFTFPTSLTNQASYIVTTSAQPGGQVCSVLNGMGIVVSANVTNVFVSCINPPVGGSGLLLPSGGTVSTPAATVTAPPGASVTQQNVTITTVAPPAGLPRMLASLGAAIDISVDSPATINAPFLITLPYDPTGIPDENEMAVVHYNTTTTRYEPVTILGHDTNAHTFQIDSRTFSPFVIATFVDSLLDTSHTVSFTPGANGWNINNFGSYFTPDGNCLGMAAYATWYFDTNVAPPLNGAFSTNGTPSIAQLVAVHAMLAQSQYWAQQSNTYLNSLGASITGSLMKLYLDEFDQPLILLLGSNGSAQHAGVLYGYDASGFQFYDVNVMNVPQTVSFDGAQFGTYSGYNLFTYVAAPSLGRTEDFAALTTDANGGFASSSLITVSSPTPDQQIDALSVPLTGTLSSSLNSNATVIAYVKGVLQIIPTSNYSFSGTIPIAAGDNPVVVIAGVNLAQQSNWYTNAATLIFDATGTLPPSTLLATLTWNQDTSDVDLYVTEPTPSDQTAWYANPVTTNLLSLDFDNTTGYGPEHTTLTTAGNNPGIALPGEYTIAVHYYSDYGTGQAVTGSVSIVVNEGMPNQVYTTQDFSIALSNSNNASPGSTGPDWVAIGTADLINGTITLAPATARPMATPRRNESTPQYKLKKVTP